MYHTMVFVWSVLFSVVRPLNLLTVMFTSSSWSPTVTVVGSPVSFNHSLQTVVCIPSWTFISRLFHPSPSNSVTWNVCIKSYSAVVNLRLHKHAELCSTHRTVSTTQPTAFSSIHLRSYRRNWISMKCPMLPSVTLPPAISRLLASTSTTSGS